jgi:hypothetical protein
MKTDDGVLNVVHDNKLLTLLGNLNLLVPIQEQKVKCKFCKTVITYENLNAIFPESGTIKISCNLPECVIALSNYLNEENV